jgi:hypothetical protein
MISAARPGARDATRHAQCFFIGGLIGRGDLDYPTAYDAVVAAMAVHPPRHDLDERIARSLESGMAHPLPISEAELFMRALRAHGGAKGGAQGRRGGAAVTPPPKPRLFVDKAHPELTVADLRDILADFGRIYDRGGPVRIVDNKATGGSVAHQPTADGLALEAHFACQPYGLVKEKGGWVERDMMLPPAMARMYLDWEGEAFAARSRPSASPTRR